MNASNTYRQTLTQTAAPAELVVMLYRGAARFVAGAIEALDAKNLEVSNNQLVRAQAIISELGETLSVERGGEMALNLSRIYEYLNYRLVEANLGKDPEPAREVERLLRELLPAWEAAARQTPAAGAPARPMVSTAA